LERAVSEKTGEFQERLEELELFHDIAVELRLLELELEKKVKKLGPEWI
jgi:hypothetical protein